MTPTTITRTHVHACLALLALVAVAGACTGSVPGSATPDPGATATSSAGASGSPGASASPGGSLEATTDPTPGPTPTPTPDPTPVATPTPTPQKTRAGTITLVVRQRGFVDDDRADLDDPVFARGSVRTDDNGALKFALDRKIASCTLIRSTEVDILPRDDVLVHFAAGTAVCRTTTDPIVARLTASGDVDIRLSDPDFLVTIDGDVTTVRVLSGLVEVGSAGGTVLLGPRSRSDVVAGGQPAQPGPWGLGELDDETREAVEDLGDPDVNLSRPDPGGSTVLERMGEQGTMTIGMDAELGEGSDADEFGQFVLDEQAGHWNLDPAHLTLAADEAAEALLTGEIDLLVAAGPLDGLGRIPFVDDPERGTVWLHYDPADERFGAAERDFLRSFVIDGGYRIGHLEAYGDEPDYEVLASLFDLD